jgi:hypothetical protein
MGVTVLTGGALSESSTLECWTVLCSIYREESCKVAQSRYYCQVTKSPRLYMLFRTAVPGILPVTFCGFVLWLSGAEPVTYICC